MSISSIKYIALFMVIMGACEENKPKVIAKQQPMVGSGNGGDGDAKNGGSIDDGSGSGGSGSGVGSVTISAITGLSAGAFDSVKIYWWDSAPTSFSGVDFKTFNVSDGEYRINDLQGGTTYYFAAKAFKSTTQVGTTIIGNSSCPYASIRASSSGADGSLTVCQGGDSGNGGDGGGGDGSGNGTDTGNGNGSGTNAKIIIEQ